MISFEETIELHQQLIERFGGAPGIRETGALESALARPFQTFGRSDLYPSPLQKASALMESILTNHPFVDGNKRTGYLLFRMFLIEQGHDLKATEDEKYDFVIEVADGSRTYEQIMTWAQENVLPMD